MDAYHDGRFQTAIPHESGADQSKAGAHAQADRDNSEPCADYDHDEVRTSRTGSPS